MTEEDLVNFIPVFALPYLLDLYVEAISVLVEPPAVLKSGS